MFIGAMDHSSRTWKGRPQSCEAANWGTYLNWAREKECHWRSSCFVSSMSFPTQLSPKGRFRINSDMGRHMKEELFPKQGEGILRMGDETVAHDHLIYPKDERESQCQKRN